MSRAREMLAAAPGEVELGLEEVAAAIDASLDCLQSCTSCADASVNEEDVAAMRKCIGLCLDCADVCDATARTLSRQVRYDKFLVQRLLEACVRACASCADECEKHAAHHEHCRICAEVCRACEKACRALLEAEAFEELQALAGG
jgi:hypothetical protein